MPGYQMVNPLPLNVGDLMTVQCATPGKLCQFNLYTVLSCMNYLSLGFVTSVGKTLTLPCTNSGNFQVYFLILFKDFYNSFKNDFLIRFLKVFNSRLRHCIFYSFQTTSHHADRQANAIQIRCLQELFASL